jgi:predicted DNA-binding transcriptional regulator AlpA
MIPESMTKAVRLTDMPDWLSAAQVMSWANIRGRSTLQRWCRLGLFPKPTRIGHNRGLLRWRRDDLERYAAQQASGHSQPVPGEVTA